MPYTYHLPACLPGSQAAIHCTVLHHGHTYGLTDMAENKIDVCCCGESLAARLTSKPVHMPETDWDVANSAGDVRTKRGQMPSQRRRRELPKPTRAMQAHQDLDLEKDSGTIRLVENEDGRGGGPGFYCDVCKKTCKDSVGYLDHINGRMHLRRLGQTTQAERGTLQSVKDRIAYIRAERALGATPAQRYDFDARLRQIAADQRREHEQRRRDRQEERLRKKPRSDEDVVVQDDADVMAAMGFGSFGSTR